jgi:hypothetical protein
VQSLQFLQAHPSQPITTRGVKFDTEHVAHPFHGHTQRPLALDPSLGAALLAAFF